MRLLNKIKSLPNWVIGVNIGILLGILIFTPLVVMSTFPATYTIDSPTKEQVELIIKGNPEYRVWFNDAKQVYQGSSIIIVEMKARTFEGERIPEFFDEIGVDYKRLK